MSSIASFLFPEYRRKVLGLLLLHPNTRFHVREIARLTHTSAGSLHRELSKLAKIEVLLRENTGHQVYYKANTSLSIFEELASILRKTSGLSDVLKEALMPLTKKIDVAFIFGSVGRGEETSSSDIDLLIIGPVNFADIVKILYPAQTILKREINPKIYTLLEWKKLLKNKNSFVKDVLKKPKHFIIGNLNDIK